MVIKITEEQEKLLIKMLKEDSPLLFNAKVDRVKDYINKHFARANQAITGEDGKPTVQKIVTWMDEFNQAVKPMTDAQMFYHLQDEFKDLWSDKNERDKNIKQIMIDWYNHKLDGKKNTLTAY